MILYYISIMKLHCQFFNFVILIWFLNFKKYFLSSQSKHSTIILFQCIITKMPLNEGSEQWVGERSLVLHPEHISQVGLVHGSTVVNHDMNGNKLIVGHKQFKIDKIFDDLLKEVFPKVDYKVCVDMSLLLHAHSV